VLLLDNYDSFTWNLAHALEQLGADVEVLLNDAITPEGVARGGFEALVISPGPGRPEGAGISLDVVRQAAGRTPLLGVCLGHQAIARAFGARVARAPHPVHGKISPIVHDGRGLYRGLPRPFAATRYHSLAVERAGLPDGLIVDAWTAEGVVMGLRHRDWPLWGVQFHPESVLTREGPRLLGNFLALAADWNSGGGCGLPRPANGG